MENEVLFDAYDITKTAQNKVALIYQQTGQCPVDLALNMNSDNIKVTIDTRTAGVPETDCTVTGTIQDVRFPIRYLNEQTLVFYHVPDSDPWRCTGS